jgi:hypothetical protein
MVACHMRRRRPGYQRDRAHLLCKEDSLRLVPKKRLSMELKISDIGEIHWVLSISVQRDHAGHTISLGKAPYMDSILQRFGFDYIRPLSMPMDPHVTLDDQSAGDTSRIRSDVKPSRFARLRESPLDSMRNQPGTLDRSKTDLCISAGT